MTQTKSKDSNQAAFRQYITQVVKTPKEMTYATGEGTPDVTFTVYPVVTFEKRANAVRSIVDTVLSDDASDIYEYTPEWLTLARKHAIVTLYTDITLPTELDEMWLILNYTPLYEDVVEYVGRHEVSAIFKEADQGIEARKQYLAQRTDLKKFLSSLSDKLTNITTQFTADDIEKMAGLLQNVAGIDAETIVKAVNAQNQGTKKE